MPAPLTKLIPTGTLVAIFGYLAWSYLEMAPAPGQAAAPLPEIAKKVLEPALPPPTTRDPFGESIPFALGEFKDPAGRRPGAAAPKATGANQTKTVSTTQLASRPSNAPAPVAAGGKPRVSETRTADKESPPQAPPTDLVLNATVVRGGVGLAMINGRPYKLGEQVESTASNTKWTIGEIQQHRVVLTDEATRIDLKFLDQFQGPPATGPTAVPGRSLPVPNRPGATPPGGRRRVSG